MTFRSLSMLGALLALGACGDDSGDAQEEATNECPTELSYAAVAEPFLEEHCETCHSARTASVLGDGNVIDSEAKIREHGAHLYDLVLSGEMPKSGTVPEAEKQQFLDWMDCSGASSEGHDHEH